MIDLGIVTLKDFIRFLKLTVSNPAMYSANLPLNVVTIIGPFLIPCCYEVPIVLIMLIWWMYGFCASFTSSVCSSFTIRASGHLITITVFLFLISWFRNIWMMYTFKRNVSVVQKGNELWGYKEDDEQGTCTSQVFFR